MLSACGSTIMIRKDEIDHIRISPLADKNAVNIIKADTFDAFFKF